MKEKVFNLILFSSLLILFIFSQQFNTCSLAAPPIKLVADGKDITSLASPIIENGRTLVPIRFVTEELGGKVDWKDKEKRVIIQKDNQIVNLKINSYLVSSEDGEKNYSLMDVAPKIVDGRTFVPLRFVGNALGVGVEWDEATRTVNIDSSKASNMEPLFNVSISSLNSGQVIKGKTELQIELTEDNLSNAKEIKYLFRE